MSETDDTTNQHEVTEPETTDAEETTEESTTEEPESSNAEAARWRRKLRDAEGERDQLADQLDGVRRQLVEQHAVGQVTAKALWASGVTLDTLIGADGTVDYDAVDQAIKSAREAFGIGGAPKASPRQGTEPTPALTATWSDALADR
jgi:hypothetical protein